MVTCHQFYALLVSLQRSGNLLLSVGVQQVVFCDREQNHLYMKC